MQVKSRAERYWDLDAAQRLVERSKKLSLDMQWDEDEIKPHQVEWDEYIDWDAEEESVGVGNDEPPTKAVFIKAERVATD